MAELTLSLTLLPNGKQVRLEIEGQVIFFSCDLIDPLATALDQLWLDLHWRKLEPKAQEERKDDEL